MNLLDQCPRCGCFNVNCECPPLVHTVEYGDHTTTRCGLPFGWPRNVTTAIMIWEITCPACMEGHTRYWAWMERNPDDPRNPYRFTPTT